MTRTPWLPEALQALAAIFRLARFDRHGAGVFTDDLDQCARSFRACVLAAPFFMGIQLYQLLMVDKPAPDEFFLALVTDSTAFVIQCVLFPLVLIPLLRWYRREAGWARAVTAYNWCNLAQLTFLIGVDLVFGGLNIGQPFAQVLTVLADLFCFVVEGFIFEVILEVGVLRAAILVLVNIVLDQIVTVIAGTIG